MPKRTNLAIGRRSAYWVMDACGYWILTTSLKKRGGFFMKNIRYSGNSDRDLSRFVYMKIPEKAVILQSKLFIYRSL